MEVLKDSPVPAGPVEKPLQILIPVPDVPPELAGAPAVVRTARTLAEDGRVFLCTRARDSIASWKPRLAGLPIEEIGSYNGSKPIGERLDPEAPLLLLAPNGYPQASGLRDFLRDARASGRAANWVWHGKVVAAYHPEAAAFVSRLAPGTRDLPGSAVEAIGEGARRSEAASPSWHNLADDEGLRRAEESLFRSLRSDSDGYLARLDRTLSIALSRRLIRTPITPNQITAFSLAIGLSGAALLAAPGYWTSVLGAALLWSCCVLDGCDGEVARLKLMSSPLGATFDVIADNIVHIAIFAAIPVHLRTRHPGMDFRGPGLALLSGVLLSMFWVWWLILRRPRPDGGVSRVYERIASRDFIYLVAALTVAQRLEWFLWSAAVGAHLFWMSLVAMSLFRPRPLR